MSEWSWFELLDYKLSVHSFVQVRFDSFQNTTFRSSRSVLSNGKNRQNPIHYLDIFFVVQGVCSLMLLSNEAPRRVIKWNVSRRTLFKGAGEVGYRRLVMNRIKILCKPMMIVGVPPSLQGHEDLHPGGPPPLQHVRQVGLLWFHPVRRWDMTRSDSSLLARRIGTRSPPLCGYAVENRVTSDPLDYWQSLVLDQQACGEVLHFYFHFLW
jgi:hypothetical protein